MAAFGKSSRREETLWRLDGRPVKYLGARLPSACLRLAGIQGKIGGLQALRHRLQCRECSRERDASVHKPPKQTD
jgi:hypothetical protein